MQFIFLQHLKSRLISSFILLKISMEMIYLQSVFPEKIRWIGTTGNINVIENFKKIIWIYDNQSSKLIFPCLVSTFPDLNWRSHLREHYLQSQNLSTSMLSLCYSNKGIFVLFVFIYSSFLFICLANRGQYLLHNSSLYVQKQVGGPQTFL